MRHFSAALSTRWLVCLISGETLRHEVSNPGCVYVLEDGVKTGTACAGARFVRTSFLFPHLYIS
jgi:hypothetical protein